jgi:rRNA maturation RNase YbeY
VFGESLEREILRYVAHGILHLIGYDDATERRRAGMRKEEDKLLALIWP